MSKPTNPQNEATPPPGHDWGERTLQADEVPAGYWKPDAYEIRQRYGIPQLDAERDYKQNPRARMTYPNLLIHEHEGEQERSTNDPGGEMVMLRGKKGSGKSTLLLEIEQRILDENAEWDGDARTMRGELVVRRGSSKRSEWLPFRHWATVWLPASVDYTATWVRKLPGDDEEPIEEVEDLEDVVREVRRYDGVFDLLEQLAAMPGGTYNVVYPDPAFADCERATQITDYGQFGGALEFTPAWEATEDREPTPLAHWWFGFLPALFDTTYYNGWLTITFDELGDLSPEWASNEAHNTWKKMTMLRGLLAEQRREWISFVAAMHRDTNLNSEVQKEFERWIWMPDGKPNPTKSGRVGLYPPGFDTVPMKEEWMQDQPVGVGCCFTEEQYTPFSWGDISDPAMIGRKLVISFDEPGPTTPPTRSDQEPDEPELAFDERIFGEWENQTDHRLYVKEPGAGYVDVDGARIVEDLESPVDGLVFLDELAVEGGVRAVKMRKTGSGETITVAKLPDPSGAFKADPSTAGVGR